jgi:hypothetical protein
MNKTFTKIVAFACCLMGTSAFAQLTPELLYYKFDGIGTNVPNYASTPPPGTTNATLMGGLTQGTGSSEICGGSVIGSGNSSTTDYVNTGYATNLTGTSWTISFRTSNVSSSSTLFYIFGDANAGSFRCFTNGVAGPNNWILRGTGITDVLINGGATVAAHMCTYVYDITTNTIYGYLDGVLVNTVAQGGPVINSSGPFKVIGYATNVGMPSGGQMDEFRLYSRALTQAEITQLYNPFTPSGFTGSDVAFCTGGSVTLNIGNWPYTDAAWSNASISDTAIVHTPGTYIVSMSGTCGTGNDTIVVNDTRTSSSMSPSICSSTFTAPSGDIYSASGTYHDTISNVAGCDSLITINLTLRTPTTSTIAVTSCGMYTAPSGQMIMSSGTYMDTIPNVAGCDSVITINATINQPTQSAFAVTACGMYTSPSGMMIMSSGTIQDTITNAAGCDSAMTISVTINQPSMFAMAWNACDSYTAPSGAVYTTSGAYFDTIPNAAGCDSIISIQLTINNATASAITVSACDQYLAPSGIFLDSTGTYTDIIPNAAGCDSVITIGLTVTYSSTASMNVSACTSYTGPSGTVYTQSGTFNDIIPNAAGCDSIISIGLQITPLDTTVTVIGIGTLQATQSGATYQWLDCSTMQPVAVGGTSQLYNPQSNGTYCCIVTNGSCSDTSGCHYAAPIGIAENPFAAGITLYPNPNSGNFNIDLGATYNDVTVVITDLAGRIVYSHMENNANVIPVQLDAAAGTYVIIVTSGENQAMFRVNKQ